MGQTDKYSDEPSVPGGLEVIKDTVEHEETLRPKDATTKDLKELFTDEISQLVESIRQLTGTDLSAETFSPEIERTVTRLLDQVSNTVLLDPM